MRYTGELRESTRDDRGHRRWQAAATPGTVDARSSRQVAVVAFHPREELSDGYHRRQQTYRRAGRARQPRRGRSALRQLHRRRVASRPCRARTARTTSPVTGHAFTQVARSTAEDIELALDAAHAAKTPWGEASLDRARSRPERDRRPHRREPRDARGRGELGQRQAGPRDAGGGHPARGRPLPLLRRRDPRARGLELGDRPRHGRLPLPRAARRRRPDHPVQLPAADGRVEGRAGARRRQLHAC